MAQLSNVAVRRALVAAVFGIVLVIVSAQYDRVRMGDSTEPEQSVFATFYCAGSVVNAGADPYRVEPLRTCELMRERNHTYPWMEPAPLPGYTLAGFALLARLPFGLARLAWGTLLIVSVAITAIALSRAARVPPLVAVLALALADGRINFIWGEMPPLAIALLACAAAAGAAGRMRTAALCAAAAMCEPHIALPACISMFVWWPRTRRTFAAAAVALAALNVATVGVPVTLEYFTRLLPQQAAAEIGVIYEYSLTYVLHAAGAADRFALAAGTASYAIMTAFGVLVARRLAAAVERPELIVLFAPAVAMLGGAYVHDLEIAAAIPAALIIATATQRAFAWRLAALVLLCFWWRAWPLTPALELLAFGSVLALSMYVARSSPRPPSIVVPVALAALCVGVWVAFAHLPHFAAGPIAPIPPASVAPDQSASTAWKALSAADPAFTTPTLENVADRIPTWSGLVILAALGARFSRARNVRSLISAA